MDYYEYHYLVKDLTEHLKAEREANDKQNEATSQYSKFKQPNVPKMSAPKMSTPKMPKMK